MCFRIIQYILVHLLVLVISESKNHLFHIVFVFCMNLQLRNSIYFLGETHKLSLRVKDNFSALLWIFRVLLFLKLASLESEVTGIGRLPLVGEHLQQTTPSTIPPNETNTRCQNNNNSRAQ
jgi:hypothetical protein